MAIAGRWLSEHYNHPGVEIINHYTYAIVSDGDLQEGVTSEAASLAGTLRLGKLIYLYDDNDIQIEGSTDIAFSENVARRFDAYGWPVTMFPRLTRPSVLPRPMRRVLRSSYARRLSAMVVLPRPQRKYMASRWARQV